MGKRRKINPNRIEDEKYYYGRDKDGHAKVFVCLLKTDLGFCRGVSIVSPSERVSNVTKKDGRNRARGRALKAFYHKKHMLPIQRAEAKAVRGDVDCKFKFKSYFACSLDTFERSLFSKRNGVQSS